MSGAQLARATMQHAREQFAANVGTLTLDEALFTAGGHRSILGVLKHLGGWLHVYWSYAFEAAPKHWERTSWPRGLRDEVDTTDGYLREVIAWIDEGLDRWQQSLTEIGDADLERLHPLHWRAQAPLADLRDNLRFLGTDFTQGREFEWLTIRDLAARHGQVAGALPAAGRL